MTSSQKEQFSLTLRLNATARKRRAARYPVRWFESCIVLDAGLGMN
jgi:hypothetical protein